MPPSHPPPPFNPYEGPEPPSTKLRTAKAFAMVAGLVALAVITGAVVVLATHHGGGSGAVSGPTGPTISTPTTSTSATSTPTTSTSATSTSTTEPGPSTTNAARAAVVSNFCSSVLQFQQATFGTPSVHITVPDSSALTAEAFRMGFLAGVLGQPYEGEIKDFSNAANSGDLSAVVSALDELDVTCNLPMAKELGPSV